MNNTKNQAKRIPTSDAIAEAGFRLLSRNPGANLAEIAEAAGITRATLHRYFPSRQALVNELAARAIEEMDAAVAAACADSASAGDALRDSLQALIPLGDRHGFLAHEDVEQDDAMQAEFARLQRETLEWVDAAKQEGVFDAAVPSDWIVRAYDFLLYAAWDSVHAEEATPKQAAELAWRTLTSGLGAKP